MLRNCSLAPWRKKWALSPSRASADTDFPAQFQRAKWIFQKDHSWLVRAQVTILKIIKRGKIPEPLGCCFHKVFFWASLHAQGYSCFLSLILLGHFPLPLSSLYCSPKPKLCVYDPEQSWSKLFFFKERSLDKTQPWLQLEAAGISVPCFNAWPLSWNPGEFTEAGVEEGEEEGEERHEPLHPKWDFRRIYSHLFWRLLRFYYPSTSSYNAPWSSGLSPCQGSSSLLTLERSQLTLLQSSLQKERGSQLEWEVGPRKDRSPESKAL